MKALDTNVLLRYILQDDKRQSALAGKVIESATDANRRFVNLIVLLELVWVLTARYGYSRLEIADLLEKVLSADRLWVENSEVAMTAVSNYRRHNIDFADALIGALNKQAGCTKTVTFDKRAAKLAEFEILS